MKITKVILSNFRSFKNRQEINFEEGMNIFVGMNNVGKTNLFLALKKLRSTLEANGTYSPIDRNQVKEHFNENDWNLNSKDEFMELEVHVTLTQEERKTLFHGIGTRDGYSDKEKQRLSEEFRGFSFLLRNRSSDQLSLPILKLGALFIQNDAVTYDPVVFERGGTYISLGEAIAAFRAGKKSFQASIKDMLIAKPGTSSHGMQPLYFSAAAIFAKNLKIFEDIRKRPQGGERNVEESLSGEDAAAALLRLMTNESSAARDKYIHITKEFNSYFPDLNLIAIKRGGGNPDIQVKSESHSYEHSLNQAGAGIMEFVLLLLNLTDSKDKVFVIQEPELHNHPSLQRVIAKMLAKHGQGNQIIVITHSPIFVNYENIVRNSIVRYVTGETCIIQADRTAFTEDELSKIRKLRGENKELFFSKAVLLVEGQTELGAIPVFAEKIGKDFDSANVFVCCVYGSGNFAIYQKLLEAFEIPYTILCDGDALALDNVKKCQKKVACEPDFETILRKNNFGELLDKAMKECDRSKPRAGAYVAENVPRDKIPAEFIQAIEEVTKL